MFFQQYHEGKLPYSVIIEDDGETGYAYLLLNKAIISDVWLYNVDQAKNAPAEWQKSEKPPQNLHEFTSQDPFPPLSEKDSVIIRWRTENDTVYAYLYIRDRLHAVLQSDKKPGWSLLANKNGPVAHRLDEAPLTSTYGK